MKHKEILTDLIAHFYDYESTRIEGNESSLLDFVKYLNERIGKKSYAMRNDAGAEAPWLVDMGEETETAIARLVTVLNRYAKTYIKRALNGSEIQTGEEFSFLLYLLTFESLKKTELIQKNILEKTSGMEVIKRLLKLNYITEFDDTQDKRSKRIKLTPHGRERLLSILPRMQQVTQLVSGNLTRDERNILAYLLNKLDHYHHDIFVSDRTTDFDALLQKYLLKRDN